MSADADTVLYGEHQRQTHGPPVRIQLDLKELGNLLKTVRLYRDQDEASNLVRECEEQGLDLHQQIDVHYPGWSYLPAELCSLWKPGEDILVEFELTHSNWMVLSWCLKDALIRHPGEAGGRVFIEQLGDTISSQLSFV